jgi:translation initiation factor IF-2
MICAGDGPGHTTITQLRAGGAPETDKLFKPVLV